MVQRSFFVAIPKESLSHLMGQKQTTVPKNWSMDQKVDFYPKNWVILTIPNPVKRRTKTDHNPKKMGHGPTSILLPQKTGPSWTMSNPAKKENPSLF